ncbi:MAG: SDR family oxidoreductase [Gammaproteobacteria bacterium]|nr:SDR family oxidoreductase [Gammaproteobacteria bacterium]MCP5423539.1 SDR family oxidoreductase [Gammaproteobacteria bacterium]
MVDKVVLITGSARGIGAATAQLFARQGYAVCINYKTNAEAAERVATAIHSQGGRCISVPADVSREQDVMRLFSTMDRELGTLSVLVNNAGILRTQCRLEGLSEERINTVLINNVTSCFLCSREAVKRMSTKNGGAGGTIVNVSSIAAKYGSPNEYLDYAASKGAMDSFTKGLSLEVADEGIRVNGVRPGHVYTDIHADGGEPGRVDRLSGKIPLKRGGRPEEIAEAIYWLASEKSSFATGTVIDVAGGL